MSFDPDYASVSLLLHGDGANGTTTFTDSSSTPKIVTAYGNAQISTAQSKFGGASMAFDGVDSYIYTPADGGFYFDSDFWTIEGFFFERSIDFLKTIFSQIAPDDPDNSSVWIGSDEGKIRVGLYGGATSFTAVQSPVEHPLNEWHHFAVVCTGLDISLYVAGVLRASATLPGLINFSSLPLTFGVTLSSGGAVDADHGYWDGFLDEIRMTQDVARYTANFTPPAAPFTEAGIAPDFFAYFSAPTPLATAVVTVFAGDTLAEARTASPGPLGSPSILASALAAAYTASPGPLGVPRALASMPLAGWATAPSPLGAATATAYHDFTAQLGDLITRYAMDLITPAGPVRVPISSWQATLQTSGSNYVQCVIPACSAWADLINTATAFVIYRTAHPPGLSAIEYEMTRAPADQVQFDRGPSRYTCTLSGYAEGFAENDDPSVTYDRVLTGVRSISSGQGGQRVRCAVDWLLRPGQRAIVRGDSFVVAFINYYSPSGFDSYMDVGSRT